jgi:hypothetical protein
MVQARTKEATMKKLVVILIFILLLVFFLQLHANKPYEKERGKEAMKIAIFQGSGKY